MPEQAEEIQSPGIESNETAPTGNPDQEAKAQAEAVLDLETVKSFKFEGREWSPKDLKNAYLRQEDYSRKMNELQEQEKFTSNFAVDAAEVMKDRSLFQEFAKIYPEKYVESLLTALRNDKTPQQPKPETQNSFNPQLEKQLAKMEKFMGEYQGKAHAAEVKAYEAEIDSTFQKLGPKYPLADEATVISQAQLALDRGQTLDAKTWETIFKGVNDYHEKRYSEKYSKQFKTQQTASSRARDTKAGGGIPSQAPQKSLMKDAHKQLMAHFEGGGSN